MHQELASQETIARTGGWRAVRHFAYVDRPFRDVRRWVAAGPQRLLAPPMLHVRRGRFDLARNVRMVIGDIQIGVHSARLPIQWEDAAHPGLFPILEATLEIAPVRAGPHAMTQLGLLGRYRPPFGRIGAVADNLAGHGIVLDSVERFLDDLTDRLQDALPLSQPE